VPGRLFALVPRATGLKMVALPSIAAEIASLETRQHLIRRFLHNYYSLLLVLNYNTESVCLTKSSDAGCRITAYATLALRKQSSAS